MTVAPTPTLAPQWRPVDVPRIARCKNCLSPISAASGDVTRGCQVWRHHNGSSWGSTWCVLDSGAGVYTMADPDLSTLEWVAALFSSVKTLRGSRAHWPFVARFGEDRAQPLIDVTFPNAWSAS